MLTKVNSRIILKRSLLTVSFLALLGLPSFAHAWNLQGSCSGAPSSAEIEETVLWSATQSSTMKPSEGHYEWVWTDTNGTLLSTAQEFDKTYSSIGTKKANVLIKMVLNTGHTESITRSCNVTIIPKPGVCKLEITKSVDNVSASVGDTLTYSINFKNSGTADCTGGGVKVEDVVDDNLDYISETHSSDADAGYGSLPLYQSSTKTLRWNAHTLTPGETGLVTWKGKVKEPAFCGDFNIFDEARITSKEYSDFGTWVTSNKVTTSVSNECLLPPDPARLTVIKEVINDDGGIKEASDFSIYVKAGGTHVAGSPAAGSALGITFVLDPGTYMVGEDGPAASGYELESITGDCNFIGIVTLAAGEEKTCTVRNNDLSVPPFLGGTCAASPAAAHTGDSITFSADPSGGTGAYSYIWTGTDALSGDATTTEKTYGTTGTKDASVVIASGSETITATCSTAITDTPPGGGGSFSATCSASPSTLYPGGSADWTATISGGSGAYTYDWSGSDGLSGDTSLVTHAYAAAGSKTAQVTVIDGSQTVIASCSLTVMPPPGCTSNCGGGGFNPPTVVLFSTTTGGGTPPPGQVLGAIYLSQIPYTGLGDWYKIVLFVIILGLWSVSVVYFFRSKMYRKRADAPDSLNIGQTVANNLREIAPTYNLEDIVEVRGEEPTGNVISSYDTSSMQDTNSTLPMPKKTNGIMDIIAAEAERNRMVISEEGMKLLAERGVFDAAKVLALVDSMVDFAEKNYEREDGWLLLNKEKILGALSGKLVQKQTVPATAQPNASFAPQTVLSSHSAGLHQAKNGVSAVDSTLFVNWIATGNRNEVTRHLKELRGQPGGAEAFLRRVVLDLDAVHRARFEDIDEQVDQRLAHTVSGLSNDELEHLISVLLSTVDQSYHSPSVSAKIALMRASSIGKR